MGDMIDREAAYEILNGLPAVGPVSLNRLLDAFAHDPVTILSATRAELSSVKGMTRKAVEALLDWETHFDLAKTLDRRMAMGARFVSRESSRYPELLREIADPPIGFYCLGNYDFMKPSIAMVGSRRTSQYGRAVAESFARDLASMGFCVTSGMARGIDSHAHKGALAADSGSTVAVLGCGLNIIYPPENLDLYRKIQDDGAVISEFPFDRNADRQTFPMRNRLVSGMSEAVIVVESAAAGGSMITARFAGEQGRIVCAIPGRIDQKTSLGCNQLIRDGAILLNSVDDLLEEIRYEQTLPKIVGRERENAQEAPLLSPDESDLMRQFEGGEARGLDELAQVVERSTSEVAATLMMLELSSHVTKRLDGKYESTVRFR